MMISLLKKQRVYFLGLVSAILLVSSAWSKDTLFDKYCLVEDAGQRYPIPSGDETVEGNQKTWYTTPFDLKPGNFSMNCKGLQDVTENSFSVTPGSVCGKYTYRFTLTDDEPEGTNELPSRKLVSIKQTRFDQLKQIADRNVLIGCNVTKVFPEGKGFECTMEMASGDLPFRVEVVKIEDVPRLPEVHSRQYGPHAQHAFDIYYPKGFKPGEDNPLPMYFNIHGGGWGALDKFNKNIGSGATSYNDMGIAYVSINYRYAGYYHEHPAMKVPVAACLLDAARCIQYIRYHAKELGVDPDRICLTGGSAGGATSAWMAMVDDLADPDSSDPIARMSTRVTASTPHQAQTSIDPKQMQEWIPGITYGSHAFMTNDDFPAEVRKGSRDEQKKSISILARKSRKLPGRHQGLLGL